MSIKKGKSAKEVLEEKVCHMYTNGMSIRGIIERHPEAPNVYGILVRHKVPMRDKTKNWLDAGHKARSYDIPEREDIPRMYLEEGLSCKQISERVGLGSGPVYSVLKARGVKLRSPLEVIKAHPEKVDLGDLKPKSQKLSHRPNIYFEENDIVKMYVDQNLSCDSIAERTGLLPHTVFSILKINDVKVGTAEQLHFSSRIIKGPKHGRWTGRIKERTKYIYVWVPYHPTRPNGGKIAQHRLIMENHLGRFLTAKEIVHHINGNGKDNRIENLKVVTKKEHSFEHFSAVKDVDLLKKENKILKSLLEQNGIWQLK